MADVTLTIDGAKVTVPQGTYLIDAARKAGIMIANFCYLPGLRAYGACRLCVVELQGKRGFDIVISCGTPAAEGAVVLTNSERIRAERRRVLQALDIDHPVDCPICEASGRCDLQDYCYEFEVTKIGALDRPKIIHPLERLSPFVDIDRDRCVLCGRCVRVCDEVIGADALAFSERGIDSSIDTPFGKSLLDTACTSCGSCVEVCPVGALSSHTYQVASHHWELTPQRTTCGMCSVGCTEYIESNRNRIVQVSSADAMGVNDGVLCVSGRYGLDFVNNKGRITSPMIKRDGRLQEVGWDVALDFVANNLKRYSGDQVAGIASTHTTNEENYLFQKIMRVGLNSNNVDHDARLGATSSMQALADLFGYPAMTNSMLDIYDHSGCILDFNSNLYETHPVFAYNLQKMVRLTGQKLIVINPLRTRLVEWAAIWLAPKPGTELALLNAMAGVIVAERLQDRAKIDGKVDGYDALLAGLSATSVEQAATITGVPAADIQRAARLYASGGKTEQQQEVNSAPGVGKPASSNSQSEGLNTPAMNQHDSSNTSATPPENAGPANMSAAEVQAQSTIPHPDYKASSIVYMPGVIAPGGDEVAMVQALANLALLTGNIGKAGGGLNPFVGQNNKQGASDVGCLPNYLPGYQSVSDPAARQKLAAAWGLAALPSEQGRTISEMYKGAAEGVVKAMYVMGENPVLSDPEPERVRRALDNLEFLVVQDLFMTETAEMADAVLPAASFAEKDGTTTSAERRVNRVYLAVEPRGMARPDWAILVELAARLGVEGKYKNPGYIFSELASVMPIYAGISYQRLESARYIDQVIPMPGAVSYKQLKVQGYQWPVADKASKGTEILYSEGFKANPRFTYTAYQPTAQQPTADFPLTLTGARAGYYYNMGTLARYSRMLGIVAPEDGVRVNPQDARAMEMKSGTPIKLFTSVGEARSKLIVTEDVPVGQAFLVTRRADQTLAGVMVSPDGYSHPDNEIIPDLQVLVARIQRDTEGEAAAKGTSTQVVGKAGTGVGSSSAARAR